MALPLTAPTTITTPGATRGTNPGTIPGITATALHFAPTAPPASFDPYATSGAAGRPLAASAYMRRQIGAAALLVLAGYMLWLAAGMFGNWFVTTADASTDTSPAPALTYVVEPGDTLWSIASTIDVDRDIRDVVASLVEENGGAGISPGQVLNLRPAYR